MTCRGQCKHSVTSRRVHFLTSVSVFADISHPSRNQQNKSNSVYSSLFISLIEHLKPDHLSYLLSNCPGTARPFARCHRSNKE